MQMKLAILDENYILKEIKPMSGATSKENLTVQLPDNADIEVKAFLPVSHVERFSKIEDYDTEIVDALVCAVCDLLDGKKVSVPEHLHSSLRNRRASIVKDKK
jgi:hypothetical protein